VASLPSDLEADLATLLSKVRARWPGIRLPAADYVAALAQATSRAPGLSFLRQPHAEDLYLAMAAGRGEALAIEAFEAELFEEVDHAAARAGFEPAELRQMVRERLFAPPRGEASRISEYQGQARLRTWLRVVVSRLLLDVGRRAKRGRAALARASPELYQNTDPELELLRRKYRREFESAFNEAIGQLSEQERKLLWHVAVQGKTVDEMAALLSVPRSTAARWVADARKALVKRTRDRLRNKLKVSEGELRSILGLVRSHVHLSLSRVLTEPK
jgi:RNA polymerase sigma-70 factor (ECF subfamily)